MTQDSVKQDAEAGTPGNGSCGCQRHTTSMAGMCMRMLRGRPWSWFLLVPGVLLIALGALFVLEPRSVVWLLAAGAVLMGVMLLLMAGFMRRMGSQPRR